MSNQKRGRPPAAEHRRNVAATLPESMVQRIDRLRGQRSRGIYLEALIREAWDRQMFLGESA